MSKSLNEPLPLVPTTWPRRAMHFGAMVVPKVTVAVTFAVIVYLWTLTVLPERSASQSAETQAAADQQPLSQRQFAREPQSDGHGG
jgi:hypothetical protein